MHQAHGLGLAGAEALGGNKIAARGRSPHGPHHIGADGGGHQAQARLGQTKLHGRTGQAHIAHRGQAHATGVAVALQTPDDGHRALVQGPQHVGQALGIGAVLFPAVVGHRAHPVEVGTRAKSAAMRGQHHHPHLPIAGDGGKGLGQLGDHRVVERIAHLWPVEPDLGALGAGAAYFYAGVFHERLF